MLARTGQQRVRVRRPTCRAFLHRPKSTLRRASCWARSRPPSSRHATPRYATPQLPHQATSSHILLPPPPHTPLPPPPNTSTSSTPPHLTPRRRSTPIASSCSALALPRYSRHYPRYLSLGIPIRILESPLTKIEPQSLRHKLEYSRHFGDVHVPKWHVGNALHWRILLSITKLRAHNLSQCFDGYHRLFHLHSLAGIPCDVAPSDARGFLCRGWCAGRLTRSLPLAARLLVHR